MVDEDDDKSGEDGDKKHSDDPDALPETPVKPLKALPVEDLDPEAEEGNKLSPDEAPLEQSEKPRPARAIPVDDDEIIPPSSEEP